MNYRGYHPQQEMAADRPDNTLVNNQTTHHPNKFTTLLLERRNAL
jgi:hypothetical protein